jgi:hypothetical protein
VAASQDDTPLPLDVASPSEPAAPAPAADDAEVPAAPAPEKPVAVDAVPVGESAAPVQALQTEMLFSMDDTGTADIADVEDTRGTAPEVRFSAAGTDRAATGSAVNTDEDVDD